MSQKREGEKIDPAHRPARAALRFFGPIILIVGIALIVFSFVDFFRSVNAGRGPQYFWCFFLGIPFFFVGVVMTSMGNIGRVARYTAGEIAPVGKDTFNYLAKGTEEGVKTVAKAVGEGLGTTAGGKTEVKVRCHKCNTLVYEGAKFCPECAAPLGKTRTCPQCGELNDPDANLCDECGHRFE